jgi:hypothetical protein
VDRATIPANRPTSSQYTPPNMETSIRSQYYSYTYLLELQEVPKFFQVTDPPDSSTSLTCTSTRHWLLARATIPANRPTSSHYTPQTWEQVY